MNDILGLGKVLPIEKLIDVVSKACGKLSKPYFDRKDVDTKAYEIKKLAEARAEEMKIMVAAVKENYLGTGGIEYKEGQLQISSSKEPTVEQSQPVLLNPELAERTKDRVNYQDAKRQQNIEDITAFAAENLKNEKSVSDEPVDEGWANRFFRLAEDISDDEMKALWGKILAGEIKQPKSFSLRTLELLKNLTKEEAHVFLRLSKLVITTSSNLSFILSFSESELLENKYSFELADRLLLEELGLLNGTELRWAMFKSEEDAQAMFRIGSAAIHILKGKNTPQQELTVVVLTKIGKELLGLTESKPNLEYIKLVAARLKQPGVTVKYTENYNQEDRFDVSHFTDLPG